MPVREPIINTAVVATLTTFSEKSEEKSEEKLEDFNFKNIEIIKDNATKGKVRSIYPGLKRKFSIVVAKKV